MEWQPIDTAPKDGTTIIIGGCVNGPAVRTAHWGGGAYNHSAKHYDRDWADGGNYGFKPTHWMPLPAAPK